MKAYLIADIIVHDLKQFKEYMDTIPQLVTKHNGQYLVQGGTPSVIEGDWLPEKIVIIEFPSNKNIKAFTDDPHVQAIFEIRHNSTTSNLIMVDGCR